MKQNHTVTQCIFYLVFSFWLVTLCPALAGAQSAPDTPELILRGNASFNGTIWALVSDETASGATSYQLQVATDPDFTALVFNQTNPVPANTFQVASLSDDIYYLRTRALNGAVPSSFSRVKAVTVETDRDFNVFPFFSFSEVYEGSGSVAPIVDASSNLGTVTRCEYSTTPAAFSFRSGSAINISNYKSMAIRVRADIGSGPMRLIIDLREGPIEFNLPVSIMLRPIDNNNVPQPYADYLIPFYGQTDFVDNIRVRVEDASGGLPGQFRIDDFFFSTQEVVGNPAIETPLSSGFPIADIDLLDQYQARAAQYFYDKAVGPGFVLDRSNAADLVSIGATGFGLSALTVLAKRAGTSAAWNNVSAAEAEARAESILDGILDIQANQAGAPNVYGQAGFPFHFIFSDGTRAFGSEISILDGALLLAGVIQAGEYFGGSVQTKAMQIFNNTDWTFFFDNASRQFHNGYTPETGFGGLLNRPTDEILIVTLLAIARHGAANPNIVESFFGYPRMSRSYVAQTGAEAGREFNVVNSFFGSGFTYFFAHCWFNFERFGMDRPDLVPGANFPQAVDWFQNSQEAIAANRQFVIDYSFAFPFSFNETSWGLGAVQRPDGRYEVLYGAPPYEFGPGFDGTIATYVPLSSFPFFKRSSNAVADLATNESFAVLKNYHDNFFNEILGGLTPSSYGAVDSYNDDVEFSAVYLGIDVGPQVLMIENFLTGMIWNTMRQSDVVMSAIELIFGPQPAENTDFINITSRNIFDQSPANDIGFGLHGAGAEVVNAGQFLEIRYGLENSSFAGVHVYTDNQNNTIPYTGDGDGAGLGGETDSSVNVPMFWVVFDHVQLPGYNFQGNPAIEAFVMDKNAPDWDVALGYRTLVDSFGNLGAFPQPGRIEAQSPIYVYFGADFNGKPAQSYSTQTLTVEVYHV